MIEHRVTTFRRRLGGGLAALAVAAGVNGLILWGLANLNRPPQIHPERAAEPRIAMLAERQPAAAAEAPDEPTHQQPPEQERMELDFQPPAPQLLEIADLPLPVDTPVVAVTPMPVDVARRAEAAPPAPPAREPTQSSAARPDELTGPMEEDEVDQPPRPLSMPHPQYPRVAERRGVAGAVTLRLLINERGRVEQTRVVDVTGHDSFEHAVLDVVDRWRFTPPQHQGDAVKVWGTTTINFQPER